MAKVVMAATGSWGDVLPFVAVAHALEARGHDVEFVLPRSCHARIGDEGFTVHDSGWQIGPDELTALDIDWARGGGIPMLRTVLRDLALPRLRDAHVALRTACAGADLLVCHVNQVMAPIVAEETGMPLAALSLFPMVVPSVERLADTPFAGAPRLVRRAMLAALLVATAPVFHDRDFNRYRTELGLVPHRNYFMTAGLLGDRYLALFPPSFAARPRDWPAHARLTGFCPWDGGHIALPDDVVRYLAAGPPPVLVTVGSAASSGLSDLLERVAAALDRRGRRTLFLLGDARHRTPELERDGVVDFAPIDLVLPHCCAVVHHGGYGTTVATLRAGLPAVSVSPMPDQLWYGRRAAAQGTGIALSWRQRRRVGAAIDRVLDDPSFAAAAERYRDIVVQHDGIAATCDELETLV
jgi:UDP:flavonoid glycosyltransferase YjiC (YdhE family)